MLNCASRTPEPIWDGGSLPDAPMVAREKIGWAEHSFGGGLKRTAYGAGTLCHNGSRRVRLSPNADCVIIGEQKAKSQGSKKLDIVAEKAA